MSPVAVPDQRVTVVGEALIDIVCRPDGTVEETPGGSPANVAITLGRLGTTPRLLTRFAGDERGQRIRNWLDESGVDVVASPAARTSTARARLDTAGSADYEFDIDWSLDGVAQPPAGILHTGSIAAYLEPGCVDVRRLIRGAREASLICFDPNIRPALIGAPDRVRRRIEEFVALADVVKASDEDLRWLHPEQDIEDVARTWARSGSALVVVTRGAEGSFAVTGAGLHRAEAPRVEVCDTVGAGDTFMGALIDGLLRSGFSGAAERQRLRDIDAGAVQSLLAFAAACAAITVSRLGADPPRRSEIAVMV